MKIFLSILFLALCIQGSFQSLSGQEKLIKLIQSQDFSQESVEYILSELQQIRWQDLDLNGGFFSDLLNFVHGFLDSVGLSTEVTSQAKCTSNVHKFVSSLDTILGEVVQGDFSKLIIQVPLLIKQYNNLVDFCNSTIIEYGRFFQQIGYNWKNAVQTGYGWKRLLTHTALIKSDINNGVTAWKNKDFYSSGANFGNILAIFLFGKQPSENETNTPDYSTFLNLLSMDEKTVNSILGFASSILGPAMNNYADEPSTASETVPQIENIYTKEMLNYVLNFASSIVAPALNHYDTDDLQ